MRIGIDFDNTLACYDRVFAALAEEQGLSGPVISKQALRQRLRQQPDGEMLWQALQGEVYGRRMQQAVQFDGVDAFLRRCAATKDLQLYIVSHKTLYGHADASRCNLRTAASQWMRGLGYFDPAIYAIPENQVFFEDTQQAKVARIASLQCDYFIDDLPEVFAHPSFPVATLKILYASAAAPGADRLCASWQAIEALIFGN